MRQGTLDLDKYLQEIQVYPGLKVKGRVAQVIGLVLEVSGLCPALGEICIIEIKGAKKPVLAEVVGFRQGRSLLIPLGDINGVSPGCLVRACGHPFYIKVGPDLLGKVLNGLGNPIEGGELQGKVQHLLVERVPPGPLEREPITKVMGTGIRAVDMLLTCGEGQRMGIFSGSGVGKSTVLAMIARHSEADVIVIGLIGERGREVLDFIRNSLGPEGLKRSVVVASTSDRPALERVKAALVATTVAEYFRDAGKRVILVMDSVTRFAMALREIGLAIGEPPTTKGYTPSVFASLPRLLERTGNARDGSITGFYSVLVDGDDFTEPICDAVRSILDGHIILHRELAARNHFPAIDILNSVSRLMPVVVDEGQRRQAGQVRELLSVYRESEDLINIGAYAKGSNPRVDQAIAYRDQLTEFLCQDLTESSPWQQSKAVLLQALALPPALKENDH